MLLFSFSPTQYTNNLLIYVVVYLKKLYAVGMTGLNPEKREIHISHLDQMNIILVLDDGFPG
jgi:hypothetical protein